MRFVCLAVEPVTTIKGRAFRNDGLKKPGYCLLVLSGTQFLEPDDGCLLCTAAFLPLTAESGRFADFVDDV